MSYNSNCAVCMLVESPLSYCRSLSLVLRSAIVCAVDCIAGCHAVCQVEYGFSSIAEVAGRRALSTAPWQLIAGIHCSDDRSRSRVCDDEERDGGNPLITDVVSGNECVRWLWGGAVTPLERQV